jgi:hypothetical protein
MTDVVNLNKFKKAKKKQEKAKKAQENRIVHGLSGIQKAAARAEAERIQVQLEQQRLENGSQIKTVDDSE